jgi:hypothetical protein
MNEKFVTELCDMVTRTEAVGHRYGRGSEVVGCPGCGVLGRRLANTSQSYAECMRAGSARYDVIPSPQRDRCGAPRSNVASDFHAWVRFHFLSRNLGISVFTGPAYYLNAKPHFF